MSATPHRPRRSALRTLLHHAGVLAGAGVLTLLFFLVLPVIQAINRPPDKDRSLYDVDTTQLPPPPPPLEEEPEDEPEEEEPPPELDESPQLLDLEQLEVALNPGLGGNLGAGDFALTLNTVLGSDGDLDALFSISDLDQKPRVIYQPGPVLDAKLRRRTPGEVYVLFIVNEKGSVENPTVQKSTDPLLEKPALSAVKQWKFEPGKRNGQTVRFRMRVPVIFRES